MKRYLSMMWAITAIVFMFIISINDGHAMSFKHAKEIYGKVTQANGMHTIPVLVFKKDSSVNAESYGYKISLNTGLLRDVKNDSEMALVLGHELAHGRLGHTRSTPPNEYAADKLGSKYMNNAGYNICVGAKMLKRFGNKASSTHPAGTDRYKRLGCS